MSVASLYFFLAIDCSLKVMINKTLVCIFGCKCLITQHAKCVFLTCVFLFIAVNVCFYLAVFSIISSPKQRFVVYLHMIIKNKEFFSYFFFSYIMSCLLPCILSVCLKSVNNQ